MKFRKKPVVIDAWQYDHGLDIASFKGVRHCVGGHGHIQTLEGEMMINDGDWLIRGVKQEYYACRADIFKETYEAVE
jgi:hypothetical protein